MDTASLTPQVKITCLIFVQFDCEDDYRTGCRNVSNCEQQDPIQDYVHPDDEVPNRVFQSRNPDPKFRAIP